MTQPSPFIGCKISLISKMDIRYEGILFALNTQQFTIALTKVHCLGTENRPTANPVAAKEEIFEYIIFKSSDIKDLTVCETPAVQSGYNNHLQLPNDPAILSASSQHNTVSGHFNATRYPSKHPNTAAQLLVDKRNGSGMEMEKRTYERNSASSRSLNVAVSKTNPSRRQQNNGTDIDYYHGDDYDFVRANEQFEHALSHLCDDLNQFHCNDDLSEKNTACAENEKDRYINSANGGEEEHFYDKSSSFFDRISCDSLQKKDGKMFRKNWRKELEINKETFGQSAVRSYQYQSQSHRGARSYFNSSNNARSNGYTYNNAEQRRGSPHEQHSNVRNRNAMYIHQ